MHCALCKGGVTEVMDFGDVALAGAFLKPEQFSGERLHRLRLGYCSGCFLLQVMDRIPSSELFSDYFYRTSAIGTMRRHFERLADEIVGRFNPKRLIEIGCNDGALLKPLAGRVDSLLGVDPACLASPIEGAGVIHDYFTPSLARDLGKADMVVACNVFAHMEDLNGVTAAVRDILTDDGVFIIEVNRLDSMVADRCYDWVYHEHLFYYSLMALQKLFARRGLEAFDVKNLPTHSGSMRIYVGKWGQHPVQNAVGRQLETEAWYGLDKLERFQKFAADAHAHRAELRALVEQMKPIPGYGACGRANTLIQFCGFTTQDIPYIVDDAPAKQGFYTPGSHIPVVSRAELKSDRVLVFAWSFMDEIAERCKDYRGKMIVPLPNIQTFERRAAA